MIDIEYSTKSSVPWKTELIDVLSDEIKENEFWSDYFNKTNCFSTINIHLGIFIEPYLQFIIDGKKTLESRFSINQCPPYGKTAKGDLLLIKRSGGPILAISQITDVWTYQLNKDLWDEIKDVHAKALCIENPEFWQQKKNSKYVTLMRVKNIYSINPINFIKRDRRGWVVLNSKSEPLNLFV